MKKIKIIEKMIIHLEEVRPIFPSPPLLDIVFIYIEAIIKNIPKNNTPVDLHLKKFIFNCL